jgi:hypothetical protein
VLVSSAWRPPKVKRNMRSGQSSLYIIKEIGGNLDTKIIAVGFLE